MNYPILLDFVSPICIIVGMEKMNKLLKGHKYICFLDLEGTQFSHEMIALGAVLATLDKKGNIKRYKPSIKIYVKAKNKIGKYVVTLTGITEEILAKDGMSFAKAMDNLRNYCGSAYKKCSFITFGNHDLKILSQSVAYNMDVPKDICSQIQHNYIDYSLFLSEFVKDPNGNPYSLVNYCKLFNVPEAGTAHEPDVDAINLAHLYQAVNEQKELVLEEYLKVLAKYPHLPSPIKEAVAKLTNGENYLSDDFVKSCENYIK